jgi:hypothetical protein
MRALECCSSGGKCARESMSRTKITCSVNRNSRVSARQHTGRLLLYTNTAHCRTAATAPHHFCHLISFVLHNVCCCSSSRGSKFEQPQSSAIAEPKLYTLCCEAHVLPDLARMQMCWSCRSCRTLDSCSGSLSPGVHPTPQHSDLQEATT